MTGKRASAPTLGVAFGKRHQDADLSYRTQQIDLAIGPHRLALRVLESFEACVNELCDTLPTGISDAELLARCPFFGKIWPSARAVAGVLARRGATGLTGASVLELGCGLGLPSLLAARLGARVLATDFHPDVPAFLARNLGLNGLDGQVGYAHVDWRDDHAHFGVFDLVVATDVLYGPEHPAQLARVLASHMSPGGRALVADPGRFYLQEFVGRMAERGFDCELECVDEVFVLDIGRHRH